MERYNPFELRKFVAPEFLFGSGAIEVIDRYIKNLGVKKVLVVTDPGVIRAGWAEIVERLIKGTGIPFAVFGDVTENPKDYEVMEGAELYRREGCDMIVAVGGGSPMDCAKGIGIVSTNNKNVLEFEGVDTVPLPGPPLICIPTTAGSSADVSQFAIILDSGRKVKIASISKSLVPDVAIIDPITTTTMSHELTAATGLDALTHAFEAYVSNASSPVTDVNALKAVKLISHNLVPACEHHHDLRYRDRMMLASLLAGLAFSNASLGLVHAMAHALGGLLDLPHGECNALLLEHVVKYNFYMAADRYNDLAAAMGIDVEGMGPDRVKDALINEISSLRARAGLNETLGSIGVKEEMISELSKFAAEDPCIVTNPRDPDIKDIEGIYAKAL
ncbi:MAG TPA: iron-containing alcohol dehydrogenase [Spirochaetota bacterium]|mgnify:CR=1 FL=1|nr:iron-containing alcohol dehydrogenase [Spirochaetota bacterium]HPJ33698.1 iron-containing alcohol dehydrogenase [Spirochaetota bacterium]